MPRSFVCPTCGRDVCRQPVRREPVYHWLVTDCPGCGAVLPLWEGGKHPFERSWRHAAAIVRAVALAVLAVAVLGGLLLGNAAISDQSTRVLHAVGADPQTIVQPGRYHPPLWKIWDELTNVERNDHWIPLVMQLAIGLAIGAAARLLLSHQRLWVTLLGATLAAVALGAAIPWLQSVSGQFWAERSLLNAITVPCIALLCVPLGYPFGSAVDAAAMHMQRQRVRRLRRSYRTRRA